MLRIFKHGVKLFGGEFLRSNGNAKEQNKPWSPCTYSVRQEQKHQVCPPNKPIRRRYPHTYGHVWIWKTTMAQWLIAHKVRVTLALPHFGGHAGHLIRWHWGLNPPPHQEVRPSNPLVFCPDARLVSWEERNSSVPHFLHLLSDRTTQTYYSGLLSWKEGVSCKERNPNENKIRSATVEYLSWGWTIESRTWGMGKYACKSLFSWEASLWLLITSVKTQSTCM